SVVSLKLRYSIFDIRKSESKIENWKSPIVNRKSPIVNRLSVVCCLSWVLKNFDIRYSVFGIRKLKILNCISVVGCGLSVICYLLSGVWCLLPDRKLRLSTATVTENYQSNY